MADLKEIDLANDEEVIKMLSEKNEKVNRNIEDLIDLLQTDLTTSNNVNKKIEILTELKQMSFEIKVQYKKKVGIYDTEFIELEKEIDNLIKILKFGVFRSFTQEKTKILIKDLTDLKESSIQEMRKVYLLIKQEITNDLRN